MTEGYLPGKGMATRPRSLQQQGPTNAPTPEHTKAVLQAFVDAYNRHDTAAVLGFFDWRQLRGYADCDFAWVKPVFLLAEQQQVRQWLRERFAEHDRFDQARIIVGTPGDPWQPEVGLIDARRTNDILEAMGLASEPTSLGSKWVLDHHGGDEIVAGGWASFNDCESWRAAPPSGLMETRAVVQAFIDGYNDHNPRRVLQTMSRNIVYTDCDYATYRTVTMTGKRQVREWLRARFKEGDRFDQVKIAAANQGQPDVAGIQASRTSTSLQARQLAPLATRAEVVLGGAARDHISRVVMSEAGARCGA